ncbi:MAG: HmuY family protein [Chitinophagaceae bacterium]|nr:HmuY family protein [Chitinophagaceae bacterium]
MMNMRMWAAALAVVAVTGVACEKDNNDENVVLELKTVTNLPADTVTGFSPTGRPIGTGRFTYFSLRENRIITGADTLTNKWDIAFREFFIKVNGGSSATGGGNAAAFIANSTFEAFTTIPASTAFVQDNAPVFAISPAPGGWYTYNPATFIALPIPGKVFVIRTADGRYAKMEITSFYRNGVTPEVSASPVQKALNQFFYQFRFVFQANGSVNF